MKMPLAVVHPDAVGSPVVVARIQIGRTVTIEVAKSRGEPQSRGGSVSGLPCSSTKVFPSVQLAGVKCPWPSLK